MIRIIPASDLRMLELECALNAEVKRRDYCSDMADKLSEAIAEFSGGEIGEHSNINCPWRNALEIIEALGKSK